MIEILKFEWTRAHKSKLFWVSIFLGCILSAIAAAQQFCYYYQGIDQISVFYRWIGQANITFGSYYLFELVPLLAALGYSHTVCTDRTHGYANQIVSRVSKKQYFFAKYIVSFVSGGIIFMSSLIFNYLLLSSFMIAEMPEPVSGSSFMNPFQFCPVLYFSKPYTFLFIWLIVSFFWGGTMAIIGLTAGMFTNNQYTATIFPFMLFISESVIGSYVMQKNIFHMGYYSLQLVWTGLLCASSGVAAPADYNLLTLLCICSLTSILYWIRVRKYDFL